MKKVYSTIIMLAMIVVAFGGSACSSGDDDGDVYGGSVCILDYKLFLL